MSNILYIASRLVFTCAESLAPSESRRVVFFWHRRSLLKGTGIAFPLSLLTFRFITYNIRLGVGTVEIGNFPIPTRLWVRFWFRFFDFHFFCLWLWFRLRLLVLTLSEGAYDSDSDSVFCFSLPIELTMRYIGPSSLSYFLRLRQKWKLGFRSSTSRRKTIAKNWSLPEQ